MNNNMTNVINRSVYSTSDHFPLLSFYCALASGSKDIEQVDEAQEHKPVWGLRAGADPVVFNVSSKKSSEKVTAVVHVIDPGAVGTSRTVDRMTMLTLTMSSGIPWDKIWTAALEAYKNAFGTLGMRVYYTRKSNEDVYWKYFGTIPDRSIGTVKMTDGIENELLQDARKFLNDENVYAQYGRPYKRVYCLHGPPGTGKTSLITAIVSELKRSLAIFNVDSLRDDTFIDLLSEPEQPERAVLLFEDVDSLFRGREASSDEGGITFSTLLNALDGVLCPRGVIIFLTTNHLDRLDPALMRPGRIDKLVHIPTLSVQQAGHMWQLSRPGTPLPSSATLEALAKRGVSPAALSEVLFNYRNESVAAVLKAVKTLSLHSTEH